MIVMEKIKTLKKDKEDIEKRQRRHWKEHSDDNPVPDDNIPFEDWMNRLILES